MMRRRKGQPLPGGLKEVLFEFQRHGNIMRVVAIDPKSGTEVTMIADPRHSQENIKRLAARKLAYVMSKKQAKNEKEDRYRYL
ncbi:MAG: hypothetical protein OQK24_07140 [Magnetovibrio sp.]|nr:hypothetical protein [Magnetovibrio sp.]